jgi:D-alanyl-D-alanine carboxypeptidase
VEVPRGSEHNLGLAIDFGSISNQRIDETFDEEPESQWLKDNAWKYGFILRYPQNKQAITGVEYEAWHYRYVGKQAAKDMHERNICLEEYLSEN